VEEKGFEPETPTPISSWQIVGDFGRIFGPRSPQKNSGELNRQKFASDFGISVP